MEPEEQPIPDDACCPECGGGPIDGASHNLSAIGYVHDDILLTCEDCSNQWLCGVPIGDSDYGEDLRCSCGEVGYPHKINLNNLLGQLGFDYREVDWNDLELEINCKCENCNHFYEITRDPDENGTVLVGHPDLTGSMDDVEKTHF